MADSRHLVFIFTTSPDLRSASDRVDDVGPTKLGVITLADQDRSVAAVLAYWLRDRLNRKMFSIIVSTNKDVLDVGGGAFYLRLKSRGASWRSYTVLEPRDEYLPAAADDVALLIGDAESIPMPDEQFDLVLGIQVLEHVLDPGLALREMIRVTRTGGMVVLLAPQTGTLHLVPNHYANLTRFWFFKQASRLGVTVENWLPIGGAWRTIASRLFLMFWPVFDIHSTRDPLLGRRGIAFWLTLPLQIIGALVMFPLALCFSLVDIREEANNHLVVLRKSACPD